MRRRVRFLLVLSAAVALTVNAAAATAAEPPLPDSLTSPSFGYVVHYTNDHPYNPDMPPPDADRNFFPDSQARVVVNALNNSGPSSTGNPNGYHTGYISQGFLPPHFGSPVPRTAVWNCTDCDSGIASGGDITLPAPQYIANSEACIRVVAGHELFHHIQYAYGGNESTGRWGNFAIEGTARYMQDKIYADLDGDMGCIRYLNTVNAFLATPNQDIWESSYNGALFWNYLSEQLGTTSGEPVQGVDFVRTFWQRVAAMSALPDTPRAVREAISIYSDTRTLESLYQDFTIANYTKNLNLSGLPNASRYRYIDENDGRSARYGPVPFTTVSLSFEQSDSVRRWGAKYFQADVASCGTGVVGLKAAGNPNMSYALVAMKGDRVERINTASGASFARSLLQRPGSPYTRLAFVATGINDPSNFSYTFDCGQAGMQILDPLAPDRRAMVGALTAPERFMVQVRVTGPDSLGTPSVQGLQRTDFTVFVGDPANPDNEAPIVSSEYVGGEYWLAVQAPAKLPGSPTTYDLTVRLGNLTSATSSQSVVYQPKSIDQVLVVDKSGSMRDPGGDPKIVAAKNAASMYVDSARSTDQDGVVSFDTDAHLLFGLAPMTPANRIAAKNQIDGINADGDTSIGDGLKAAQDELLSGHGRPAPPVERWIVLQSDGMENQPLRWGDVRDSLLASGIKVNTIALGPLTDQPLLQAIARETGGRFLRYIDVQGGASGRASAASVASQSIELADAYALSTEEIRDHERLWESSGSLPSGGSTSLTVPVLEGGIDDTLLTVASGNGTLAAAVFRPSGAQVEHGVAGAEIYSGGQHTVFHLGSLEPGNWRVQLGATAGTPQYLAILSGHNRQGVRLRLYFGAYRAPVAGIPDPNPFLVGEPMPISASLADSKGAVPGATLHALVDHPDGTSQDLPLYDDGNHQDGEAGDGVYANIYTRTTQGSQTNQIDGVYSRNGSYNVTVTAAGLDNRSQTFNRIAKGVFSVVEAPDVVGQGDKDRDGMPDAYEMRSPCLDPYTPDATLDPDGDDLNNISEYKLGTDPCNADTDNGGESDGSEVNRGANYFNPTDDALPRPIDAQVVNHLFEHLRPQPDLRPNANLIRYGVDPAYKSMRLMRSTSPDGPFGEVAVFDAAAQGGEFRDSGLDNGATYYYRLQGITPTGAVSAPSHVFSGTPRADPFAPIGSVWIADGAPYISSPLVTLSLPVDTPVSSIDGGAVQMMISNSPTFAGASWQPYTPTTNWTLNPDENGNAMVAVQFRDAAGNVSEPYYDDIRTYPVGFLGLIRFFIDLRVWTPFLASAEPAAASPAGTLVRIEGSSDLLPAFADEQGQVVLDNLPPGTYNLVVEHPNYGRLRIEGVKVDQGKTVDLGHYTLNLANIYLPLIRR